jgi:hypothetical protein
MQPALVFQSRSRGAAGGHKGFAYRKERPTEGEFTGFAQARQKCRLDRVEPRASQVTDQRDILDGKVAIQRLAACSCS